MHGFLYKRRTLYTLFFHMLTVLQSASLFRRSGLNSFYFTDSIPHAKRALSSYELASPTQIPHIRLLGGLYSHGIYQG
ncbi:hypothetical protein DFJ58DRAFT_283640 [Suillus subalutaceus]|uniref:uncharacterized protein n=1 Tax=Suillus subalutaceus TaxID=48586 RepID=UPI001B871A67|nr:uncharacterized protein DFJ58DRAFT_283640 [Suillus subalutaceus]KAG1859550.1 hypothetical protein DFJ58DRAFT_283640 [Suillus subalutaceus]